VADVQAVITQGIGSVPGNIAFFVLMGLDTKVGGTEGTIPLTLDTRSASLTADARSGALTVNTRPQ
jgi:hypothetical protein